tara:strand:+ start:1149 stop:1292 length:144 start_codon:yes stop_codon:yes gene_type:complete
MGRFQTVNFTLFDSGLATGYITNCFLANISYTARQAAISQADRDAFI